MIAFVAEPFTSPPLAGSGIGIRVTDILAMLSEGVSQDDVLRDFPYLEPDDITASRHSCR